MDEQITAAYFQSFVVALVLCLSPFKAVAYAAPFVSGAWFLFRSHSASARRKAWLVLVSATGLVIAYWIFRHDYSVGAGFLAILTYGAPLLLAVVPAEYLANNELLDRMIGLVSKALIFEALVGIVQAVASSSRTGGFGLANGDAVQGTIHLSFVSDAAFSNPIYAANVSIFLLALIPSLILRKRSAFWPVLLGTIAFILASVVHMILFLIFGLTLSLIWFHPPFARRTHKTRLVFIGVLGLLLAMTALGSNLGTISYQAGLFAGEDLPKAVIVYRAVYEMPHEYPAMPFVGLGPGQFSSRASLISTGLYFGGLEDPKSVPFVRGRLSPALSDYLLDLWVGASDSRAYGGSSSAKPFFSWLSVYTELGAPALLAVFVYGAILLIRMKARAKSPQEKWLAVSTGAGICFLLLLGFQENYWEVPQAILAGLMLVQTMYANVVYRRTASKQNVPSPSL